MRIKLLLISLLLLNGLIQVNEVQAAICNDTIWGDCSGPCGTYDEVIFSTSYGNVTCTDHTGTYDNRCMQTTCTTGPTCTYGSTPDPYGNWCPDGYPNSSCSKICAQCSPPYLSCIYETVSNVLCRTDECTPAPTPNPTGGGGTGTPTPTPTGSPLIQGSVHTDTAAALSGAYCTQASPAPLSLTGWSLNAQKTPNTYSATFGFANPNTFSINTTTTGTGYTVTLDLSGQVGTDYVCSCPAPHDPNNPYLCRYTGVTSPTANVNFYLQEYDLSNDSWFQVFGSNLFAAGLISSQVPASACGDDVNCQVALTAPSAQTSTPFSSGFPISGLGNANSIRSSVSESAYHSYFHVPERTSNLNSYALNTTLATLSYDYFYELAENQVTELGNGEDLEPLLSDWTGSPWWQADEVNYIKIDGNVSIDETQGFQISSGQQLVVFVDGRLTFDDSNPNDTNRKITSVQSGDFLY